MVFKAVILKLHPWASLYRTAPHKFFRSLDEESCWSQQPSAQFKTYMGEEHRWVVNCVESEIHFWACLNKPDVQYSKIQILTKPKCSILVITTYFDIDVTNLFTPGHAHRKPLPPNLTSFCDLGHLCLSQLISKGKFASSESKSEILQHFT
jgi:hypothetical protein